jgi:hypothetical protein
MVSFFMLFHVAPGKDLCNGGIPGSGLQNKMHNAQGFLLTPFASYDGPNEFLEVSSCCILS